MKELVKKFVKDEAGLETVEYAIITGLIVAGSIVTIGLIGQKVAAIFESVDSKMPTPT